MKTSPYITDSAYTRRVYEYTIEFCVTCNREMQFDIQTGKCVLCGSDNPFGLWEEHTDEEWNKYYKNNKQTSIMCRLIKNQSYE
jgi:ribosomal protein L37E